MLQEIADGENGFSNPACGLDWAAFQAWLRQEADYAQGRGLPEGWIPVSTYFLFVDGVPVGYGRVRHASSPYLEDVLRVGNLGYGVAASQRGKGYCKLLFAGLLEKCRDLGYQRIKLFPLKSNEATLRVMLGCGGVIAGGICRQIPGDRPDPGPLTPAAAPLAPLRKSPRFARAKRGLFLFKRGRAPSPPRPRCQGRAFPAG